MKRCLPFSLLLLAATFGTDTLGAQETLDKDQNPSFAVSRSKYLLIADSLTSLHSTTTQATYKAYDWYEAREERREERRAFQRQLQLERVRAACSCGRTCDHFYRAPYRSYRPYRFR